MRTKTKIMILGLLVVMLYPRVSHAYVGPGAGISLLGALWAVIAAIGAVLAGILIWPIRLLIRRCRKRCGKQENEQDTVTESDG